MLLMSLIDFVDFVVAGFLGLAYLCVRRFRQMIPVAPLIAVGVWAMIGPNRFVMYLAPIIGVGTGDDQHHVSGDDHHRSPDDDDDRSPDGRRPARLLDDRTRHVDVRGAQRPQRRRPRDRRSRRPEPQNFHRILTGIRCFY